MTINETSNVTMKAISNQCFFVSKRKQENKSARFLGKEKRVSKSEQEKTRVSKSTKARVNKNTIFEEE